MSEAAGLALGGIALFSLFQSCVEFFEYIEVGKNCKYDVRLAVTKVYLLQTRLRQWARSLGIDQIGSEEDALRLRWPNDSGIIVEGLIRIKAILESAVRLSGRYRSGGDVNLTAESCVGTNSSSFYYLLSEEGDMGVADTIPNTSVSSTDNDNNPGKLKSLRKKVRWAVQDKKKFDSLIADLEFLITSLEELGTGFYEESKYEMPHNTPTIVSPSKEQKPPKDKFSSATTSKSLDRKSSVVITSGYHTSNLQQVPAIATAQVATMSSTNMAHRHVYRNPKSTKSIMSNGDVGNIQTGDSAFSRGHLYDKPEATESVMVNGDISKESFDSLLKNGQYVFQHHGRSNNTSSTTGKIQAIIDEVYFWKPVGIGKESMDYRYAGTLKVFD